MIQSLFLLAYSDLGLLLAVIGVYVFFAALWLVYVTTERTAKGSMETEQRIERLRNETIQELAMAKATRMGAADTESASIATASKKAIEQLRSELATARDIAVMSAKRASELETKHAELIARIDEQSNRMDSHVEEFHSDNVVASFEVEPEAIQTAIKDTTTPVFKLYSPNEEITIEEVANDLSAHDPELGLVYYKRPSDPDNLTRIWGVGATNQDLLNENGVFYFHQVAAWDDQNIAKFNDILCFRGRIEREDWVGQAKRLAAGNSSVGKAA
ncbi:MAG: hypothetical protein WBD20_10970 [Pirellulaceae bacterium]